MRYLREAFYQGVNDVRISISGPRLGPVRTTLWSSGRRNRGGKVLAAVFLLPCLVLLGWQVVRFWPLALAAAVLAALGFWGWRIQKQEEREAR